MGVKLGLLLIFLLGMTCAIDARKLVVSGLSAANVLGTDLLGCTGEVARDHNLCSLCREYVTLALDYLEDSETQTAIIEAMHVHCSQIPIFKQECVTLVDNYAPMFFKKLSLIKPKELCSKVNLCESVVALASKAHQDSCDACHHTISELLIKLKDPETELEIIQLLLNGCKSIKNYEKQCKKLIFEYGPLLLANAEHFLEKTDICIVLRACPAPSKTTQETETVDVPAVAAL